MKTTYNIGIDIGSTTLKVVVLNPDNNVVYKVYRRHKADFSEILVEELWEVMSRFQQGDTTEFTMGVSGSAGMGVSERTGIPFVQEVVASIHVACARHPEARVLIDLGGEDAKMVFLDEGKQPDIRMNGSCAGGTGSFIDQMADLMNIPVEELASEALNYNKLYPIASRCGVFAKTDMQNLISRNIPRTDISMSVLHAVALQSITTLARGREIQSKTVCIGGPLTFIPALRKAFAKVLSIDEEMLILPDNSEYFPAMGAAMETARGATKETAVLDPRVVIQKLQMKGDRPEEHLPPLFKNEEDTSWKQSRK